MSYDPKNPQQYEVSNLGGMYTRADLMRLLHASKITPQSLTREFFSNNAWVKLQDHPYLHNLLRDTYLPASWQALYDPSKDGFK